MNNPPTTSRAPIASAENLFIHTDASVNVSSSFSPASIELSTKTQSLLGVDQIILLYKQGIFVSNAFTIS